MDTSFDFYYKKCHEQAIKIENNLIAELSYSVLNALLFLKSKNILHRDIKPSNILINLTGEIKVCDFGVSGKTKNSVAETLKKGCLPYMPVNILINFFFNCNQSNFLKIREKKYNMTKIKKGTRSNLMYGVLEYLWLLSNHLEYKIY